MLSKIVSWKVLLTVLFSLFVLGCDSEIPMSSQPLDDHSSTTYIPKERDASRGAQVSPILPTMLPGCDTDSGLLLPITYLRLRLSNSETNYPQGAVILPTLVSFAICDLDTTGIRLAPKVAVYGPDPAQRFLIPLEVKINVRDAGLGNIGNGIDYYLFRFNELSFEWEFVLSAQTEGGECRYGISQNGIYAVSLDDSVIVSLDEWTITGVVTPEDGGTLNLLNSSFEVQPAAISDTTLVSFTISDENPRNLPGALPRIFEFGPEHLQFEIPAVMTIAFEDAGYDEGLEDSVYLYYQYPELDGINVWLRQPQPVEKVGRAFVVEVNHFSRYAFGR